MIKIIHTKSTRNLYSFKEEKSVLSPLLFISLQTLLYRIEINGESFALILLPSVKTGNAGAVFIPH